MTAVDLCKFNHGLGNSIIFSRALAGHLYSYFIENESEMTK